MVHLVLALPLEETRHGGEDLVGRILGVQELRGVRPLGMTVHVDGCGLPTFIACSVETSDIVVPSSPKFYRMRHNASSTW